jgi:hypothetical protein
MSQYYDGIEPGRYELTADVPNPESDKRVTRDWRKEPVFLKGLRLYARDETLVSGDKRYCRLEKDKPRQYNTYQIGPGKEAWRVLVPHLKKVTTPETFDEFAVRMDMTDATAWWVLEKIVASGEVPMSWIEAQIKRNRNEE